MSTGNQAVLVEELFCDYRFQNEWPTRVIHLITDLAERHAARFPAPDDISEEIGCFLVDRFDEHPLHLDTSRVIHRDAAGRAFYTVKISVDLDDLRRDLTRAASERYPLLDTA